MSGGLVGRILRRKEERDAPLVVVGLGNPGPKYANTRHNVGFRCVDELAARHGATLNDKRKAALLGEGRIAGKRVALVKPRTYMNLSGEAVRYALDRFRVPVGAALIVLDDLDLPLGKARLRERGGSGGHNGLNSINAVLGTSDYARLRVGIGRPDGGAVGYVLGAFAPEEEMAAREAVSRAADTVEAWAAHGARYAMDHYN